MFFAKAFLMLLLRKKKIKKNRHPRPIRGSLKPIEKTDFYRNYLLLLNSKDVVDLNVLEEFRNQYKNIIAIYLRHASSVAGRRLYISTDIIANNMQNLDHHIVGFTTCALLFYNQDNDDIISIDLSGAATNSKDYKKAFSQAKANSQIIFHRMIKKINKKMSSGAWENITQEHITQYNSIYNAMVFLVKYIPTLYIKRLPLQLTTDIYNQAEQKDNSIQEHYRFDNNLNIYKLKSKCKHNYSALNQECATFLFCCSFNNFIN